MPSKILSLFPILWLLQGSETLLHAQYFPLDPSAVADRSYAFGYCMASAVEEFKVDIRFTDHLPAFINGFEARMQAIPGTLDTIEAAFLDLEKRHAYFHQPPIDARLAYSLGANFAKSTFGIIPIPVADFDLVYFEKGVRTVAEGTDPKFFPIEMWTLFYDYVQGMRDQHLQMLLRQCSNSTIKDMVDARSYALGYGMVKWLNIHARFPKIQHQKDIERLFDALEEGLQASWATVEMTDSLLKVLPEHSKVRGRRMMTSVFMNQGVDLKMPLTDFREAAFQKGAETALRKDKPILSYRQIERFSFYYKKKLEEKHKLFLGRQSMRDDITRWEFLEENVEKEGFEFVHEALQYQIYHRGTGAPIGVQGAANFDITYISLIA